MMSIMPWMDRTVWEKMVAMFIVAILFWGNIKWPLVFPKWHQLVQFNQETLTMKLLAAEYDEEPPDNGELEGLGDYYGS